MDVLSFIKNNGLKEVPNPMYNPKSKHNTEPRTINVLDIDDNNDPLLNLVKGELADQYKADYSETEKYHKAGLNWNPTLAENGSLDKQLADTQSASSKLIHGIEQAIVSEIGIGTIKAFSDIADAIGQVIGISDHDYSNPLSRTLEEWQESFNNNVAPIYTTPGVDIANGGLTDAGWWASNMPSIMSSLTLLIPSSGIVKVGGYIGKAAKASTVGRAVGKTSTAAAKWSARATRLDRLEDAKKAYGYLTSTQGQALINEGTKVAATAALSRTMENYQEARQVYDDMYAQASSELANMSSDEYTAFLNRNSAILEGVDKTNKDEVAKTLARKSADRTFALDYVNIVSDVVQIYGLRNMFKGGKNILSKSKINRAHRERLAELAAKNAGKEYTPDKSTATSIKNWFVDNLFDSKTAVVGELGEGAEEAVNYIAQQEGMNLGTVLLDASKESNFSDRLVSYSKEAGLYESAFWGVLGGVVFQGLGSGFKRAELAIDRSIDARKRKENSKTKEQVKKQPFLELFETPEYKRRLADINASNADLQDYINNITLIENGRNPFNLDENGQSESISESEKELLKEKAYNDLLTRMTLRAMDCGNYDLLKEYLKSDEVKEALVNSGLITEEEATRYQQNAIANMEKIEAKYDENVRVLNRLSSRINRNRKEPIPVEYLQIIARQNIDHQLNIEDWERQLASWESDAVKQQAFFKDKLDSSVDYKSAVRLAFLTRQLGELEAEKKELLKNKDNLNTVSGQEDLANLNNNIAKLRDMIYNLNPEDGVSNLMFAISNAFTFVREGNAFKTDNTDTNYLGFRNMLRTLEKEENVELQSQAKEYFKQIDARLANITSSDIHGHKLLDDAIRRSYDEDTGLDKIAKDLHDTYLRIADLQTAIALERSQIAITENEFLHEVNNLHNFMNKARKEAISQAYTKLETLADKYGKLAVRNALADRYRSNTAKTDYFGETDEDIANAKRFNDIIDILHLDADANKDLFKFVDELLALHDDVKAAQNQGSTISQESADGSQNLEVDNTSSDGSEKIVTAQESETEGVGTQPTPTPITTQNPTDNPNIELKDGNETYAILSPSTEVEGAYVLDIVQGQPKATALLNDDNIYQKNGVSITDDFVITKKPIVRTNNDNSLIPVEKGIIDKSTANNVEKAELENVNNPTPEVSANQTQQPLSSTGEQMPPIQPSPTKQTSVEDEGIQTKQADDDALSSEANAELTSIVQDAIVRQLSINWEDVRIKLNEKYTNRAEDKAVVGRQIDVAIASWKRMYDRKMANKTTPVDDVVILNSSITEKTKTGKLLEDYHTAVDKLVEKYKEDVAIDKIDGKYYVRLSDLLNYCNTQSDDLNLGELLYNNLLNYMQNSDKFVLIDGNLEDVLDRAKLSTESKLKRLLQPNQLYGINFEGYIAELQENGLNAEAAKVMRIIDNLNLGDKISYARSNAGVSFSVNGTVIGKLPLPRTDGLPLKGVKQVGQLWQYNDDWTTDILVQPDGSVDSELKNLFKHWLLDLNNEDINKLNDIIIKVAYDKSLKPADIKKLANEFIKNPEVVKAIENGFVKPSFDAVKLLKGVAKIWGYTRQVTGQTIQQTNEIREASLDGWFREQVLPSFDMVQTLYNKEAGVVEVGFINDGELIRTEVEHKLPVSKAIGEKHKGTIRIAAAETIGKLTIAGAIDGQTSLKYSSAKGSVKKNSTVVIIPAKSGRHGYVHAFPATITAKQIKSSAKDVVNAIFAELKRIGEENGTPEQIGIQLQNFLMNVLNSGGNVITPLFRVKGYGVQDFNSENDGKFGFNINFADINGVYHNLNISWKTKTNEKGVINRQKLTYHYSGKDNPFVSGTKEVIDELIKVISENARFNLGFNFIKSDNNLNIPLQGLAQRDRKTGEFVIKVPNQGEFRFKSFNDFVLENDLVSLTTEPNKTTGTNYNRESVIGNQAANQTFKVSINEDASSPVENMDVDSSNDKLIITKSTASQILDILQDSKHSTTAGRRIAKLVLGPKVKNLKINNKIFDLFPQNIKFVDEYIGANAFTNTGKKAGPLENNKNIIVEPGQVVIGREWLELINGSIANKKEAIRKLVHERLHIVLTEPENRKYIEQIRDIFNEFRAKNTNKDLEAYYYLQNEKEYYTDGKLNTLGLEEFLVETLTSKELAEALNNMQTEDIVDNKKVKKSLLQKIMERLAKIFGWNIKEGSLYEKEFKLLADIMSDDTQKQTEIKSKPQEQNGQNTNNQSANFETPVTEKSVEQEQDLSSASTLDEIFFGDDTTDYFRKSSITEGRKYTSIPALVNKVSGRQQASVLAKINKGEFIVQCN